MLRDLRKFLKIFQKFGFLRPPWQYQRVIHKKATVVFNINQFLSNKGKQTSINIPKYSTGNSSKNFNFLLTFQQNQLINSTQYNTRIHHQQDTIYRSTNKQTQKVSNNFQMSNTCVW